MDIILKEDVKGLGYKDDLVTVKPGYGRNYLIPQGMAVLANNANRRVREENIRQASHKAEKIKQDAEALAAAIGDEKLRVTAKVGESGRIFGAVTPLQLSDALQAKGHEVDRRKIEFDGEVKSTGDYTATLRLHRDVHHTLHFEVVPEEA
ncbi:MAG: 50S ribosomal protein L9 [Catalinimonas sp.]